MSSRAQRDGTEGRHLMLFPSADRHLVNDANGLGRHRSELDALEMFVQMRDAPGRLCGNV